MYWASPLAIIANASFAELPEKFRVITPRLSAPIAYVPVKACGLVAPVPEALVTSSPLVRLPAPSAVNLPTAPKTDEVAPLPLTPVKRSEEHTSELQSHLNLVCRLLLEKKKKKRRTRLQRTIKNSLSSFSHNPSKITSDGPV